MRLLLPIHRLAERLKLPAAWLKEQADAGAIPFLQVGRKRLYSPDAVEAALERLAHGGSHATTK
jgi:hypothetical protein